MPWHHPLRTLSVSACSVARTLAFHSPLAFGSAYPGLGQLRITAANRSAPPLRFGAQPLVPLAKHVASLHSFARADARRFWNI